MSCAISFFELNFLPRYENSLHVSQHSVKGIIIRTTICGKQMCAKFAWIYTYIYGYAYVCIQGDRSIDIYTYIFICRLAQTHKSSGLFEIAPITWGLDTLHKLRYQRAYTASHAECNWDFSKFMCTRPVGLLASCFGATAPDRNPEDSTC